MHESAALGEPLHWDDALVSRFWDHHHATGGIYFSQALGDRVLARFQRHLKPGGRVLDFGCGPGFFLEALLMRGYRAAGIDFSEKSVARAQERNKGSSNFLGARLGGDNPFTEEAFDAVFSIEVIEHLTDEYLAATYDGVRARLAPGGVFIVTTPNQEDLQASTVFCPCCEKTFHRWQHIRVWSEQTLRASLEAGGFEIIRTGTAAFAYSAPVNAALGIVEKLQWPIKLAPNRARPNLFAVARKK